MTWQLHSLLLDDETMAYYTQGAGVPVLFISGGPGDSHLYLRQASELFLDDYYCILYDQRGTGQSSCQDSSSMKVGDLLEDLRRLQDHLEVPRIRIVGHSWGATLGLLYALKEPDRVSHLALVSLGPIRPRDGEIATANILRPLASDEVRYFERIADLRRKAVADGDMEAAWHCQTRLMRFLVRSWFYSDTNAEGFLDAYVNTPHRMNFAMHQAVNQSYRDLDLGHLLHTRRLRCNTAVVYGCQDFEPITQGYLLQSWQPNVTVELINRCGHVPWLEQPATFHKVVADFLSGNGGS